MLLPHLCGLMQKILCFLSLERAKFVPMVSVAGRAGGTTIVIKSRALTIIKCQDSFRINGQLNEQVISVILTLPRV